MNALMKFSANIRNLPLLPVALLLSAVLSAWLIYSNPVLNDDAYSYLLAADLYQTQGMAAVLDSFGWYGYSILIALLNTILPGEASSSAQVLNSLSYLLLIWSFIRLSELIWPDEKVHWFALAVILGFPLLNEMRYFIIRDTAFWALSITALLHLIRFARFGKIRNALLWCLCSLAAVVFRLEAILPLLLTPLALLSSGKSAGLQVKPLLQIEGLLLILTSSIFLLAMSIDIQLTELMRFAYRYYLPLLLNLGSLLNEDALTLFNSQFSDSSIPVNAKQGIGIVLLVASNCYAVLTNLIAALTPILCITIIASMLRKHLPRLPLYARNILLLSMLCSLLSLLTFQFIMHFQTQRYATLLCLQLLLLLPGILAVLWRKAVANGSSLRFKAVFAFLCFYFFTDSLISFGYSKGYLIEAEDWVHNNLPQDAELATNIYAIAYANGQVFIPDVSAKQIATVLNGADKATFVVVQVKAADKAGQQLLESQQNLHLLQSFGNKHGDEARIYSNLATN